MCITTVDVVHQSQRIRYGNDIHPLQVLLPSGEHLIHNVVGMSWRKKGKLNTAKPSPMDQQAAEAQEPPVLVFLGAVVHLQPQGVGSHVARNGEQLGVDMEEGGSDVEVRRALIHRQVIHIFSGAL